MAYHLEDAEVEATDILTQEKRLRDWQVRRMEVKEQMQLHPEKTLELSRVLDTMDDEHAEILRGSKNNQTNGIYKKEATLIRTSLREKLPNPAIGKFDLQLQVTAGSLEDLRRLLEIATHELHRHIDAEKTETKSERRCYPGEMSGSLGSYRSELKINDEDSNE